MNNLPLPDRRHLDAAEGWLGLGDHLAAEEELEQITPALRTHPVVLEVRYKIYAETKRWNAAVEIARSLREILPDKPFSHFHLAFSLHELKRTREAYDTLRPAVGKFPQEWLMRYNLACYACQLRKGKEAMRWLAEAIALVGKKDVCLLALDDPDLEPLWSKISEI